MSDNNMNDLMSQLSSKLGMSPDNIKNAAQNGKVDTLLKGADKASADKVKEILGDPEKTKQILSSPQAQALIKMLNKNK